MGKLTRSYGFSFVLRQISGSYTVSLETAQLLKLVVSNARFNSIEDLINAIKEVGKELSLAQPKGSFSVLFVKISGCRAGGFNPDEVKTKADERSPFF